MLYWTDAAEPARLRQAELLRDGGQPWPDGLERPQRRLRGAVALRWLGRGRERRGRALASRVA